MAFDLLHNDVLAVVAGYLVSPHDYYALAGVDRRARNVLLVARPELLRRMTLLYFRPWRAMCRDCRGMHFNGPGAKTALAHLPVRTPEACIEAARYVHDILAVLPVDERTEAVVLAAYGPRRNAVADSRHIAWPRFEHVPPRVRTRAVCEAALKAKPSSYRKMPVTLKKDRAFRLFALQCDPMVLQWMKKGQTAEEATLAVRGNWRALAHVRPHVQTPEICALAVAQSAYALELVPMDRRTYDLCMRAIEAEPATLKLVPLSVRTPAMELRAVTLWGDALLYISVQTSELCEAAVRQDWRAYRHIAQPTPKQKLLRDTLRANALAIVRAHLHERVVASEHYTNASPKHRDKRIARAIDYFIEQHLSSGEQ